MTDTITRLKAKLDRGEQLTQEDLNEFNAAAPGVLEAMASVARLAAESFRHVSETLSQWSRGFLTSLQQISEADETLDHCPDRRVAHLGRHARKYRTRKKNLHRATRILEKEADA